MKAETGYVTESLLPIIIYK